MGKKKKEKKKSNPIKRFFRKILLIVFFLIIILGGLFYLKTEENGGGLKGAVMTLFGLKYNDIEDLKPLNVLVLGVSEDLESRLTDTIIIGMYNPRNLKATMLSVPRDTFVGKNQNQAKGSDKLNAMFFKNKEKMLKKVDEITGIKVNNYFVINNNAVIEMVDILGGVKFDVPIDMDYDDPTQDLHIHLKSGMQKINGEKAEQLLRFRHNNDGSSYPVDYGDNDFGRMRTQREFIKEVVKQSIKVTTLFKIPQILSCIDRNIETNMEKEELYKYLPSLVDFDTNDIKSYQLPGESAKCNGLWFFLHNEKSMKSMLKEIEEYLDI